MKDRLLFGPDPYNDPDQRSLARWAAQVQSPEYWADIPFLQGGETVVKRLRVAVGFSNVKRILRSGIERNGQGARPGVRTSAMLTEANPMHEKIRKVVEEPTRHGSLADFGEVIVHEMNAAVRDRVGTEFDAVPVFRRLVGSAIAYLLGISSEDFDADKVAELSRLGMATQGPCGERFDESAGAMAGNPAIGRIFGAVFGGRVTEGSVGQAIFRALREERISMELAADHVASILIAGFHTQEGAIARTLGAFAQFPEQFAQLMGDRQMDRSAVEEVLRWSTPLQIVCRDLVTPENPDGERVVCCLRAANHDPTHWTQPEQLILNRAPNAHLALGVGAHHCLGADPVRRMLSALITALRTAGVSSIIASDTQCVDTDVLAAQSPLSQPLRFISA